MTNPWVRDVTPEDTVPALGWWAQELAVTRSSGGGSWQGVKAGPSQSVTFDYEVLDDYEHLVLFMASRGQFAGAYNWSLSGIPGIQYQAYRGINAAEDHGFLAFFTAYNVPKGTYAVTGTVTAGAGDTFTETHVAGVGIVGASDVTPGFWWQRGVGPTIQYTDGAATAQGGLVVSGLFDNSSAGELRANSAVTDLVETGNGHLIIAAYPATGEAVQFAKTGESGKEWVAMTVGVEP